MGLYPIKNCIKSLKYYMHFNGISLIRLSAFADADGTVPSANGVFLPDCFLLFYSKARISRIQAVSYPSTELGFRCVFVIVYVSNL